MSYKTDCPGNAAGPITDSEDLVIVQNAALDTTAAAFKCIEKYHDFSLCDNTEHLGDVRNARYYAGSAMVHLAIVAGGEDDERIRDILSGYGLQHLLYK